MKQFIILECEQIKIKENNLIDLFKKLIDAEVRNILDNVIEDDIELAQNTIKKLYNLDLYNINGIEQFENILDILSVWESAYNPYELEYKEIK